MPAMVAAIGVANCSNRWLSTTVASMKNISFDRKPFASGTPAMAALATIAKVAVTGMVFHRPFNCRISRDPVSCSMMPAAMNSEALNTA